ncbi:MAG: hypothetical protein J6Z43_03945 [Clostridiales bacterium]|nr:hypothetical protein [Clostridiales bacterium]
MGRVISIANKLDREPRFLVVDDDHRYKVDCRKNTVIQFMELSDKIDDNTSVKDSMAAMEDGIKLLIGAQALKELESMDLPFDSWQWIFKAATAVAMNKDLKDVDADFREEERAM